MFFLKESALLIILLVALAPSLHAQPIDKCANRAVTVNVRDRQGDFITALAPSSFHATIHGQPIAVSSADMEVGARVVLLLDVSGSIISSPAKWQTVKLVSQHLVASSPNSFRVALMLFASDVVETLDFRHSGGEILQRVQQLPDGEKLVPKGKRQTALMDSVLRAMTVFGTWEPGDAIFVITDGEDNASHADIGKVEKALLLSGVRFYAFALHDRYLPVADEQTEVLGELAERTGGAVLDVDSPLALKAGSRQEVSLQRMYDQIARFYRIVLESANAWDRQQRWNLAVMDGQGHELKDLKVTYVRELPACDLSKDGPGK